MNKLEKAKEIIKSLYSIYDCGIYNTRNLVGDRMSTIYDEDGLTIEGCYEWSYFEVFGLTEEEFMKLKSFYISLESEEEDEDE